MTDQTIIEQAREIVARRIESIARENGDPMEAIQAVEVREGRHDDRLSMLAVMDALQSSAVLPSEAMIEAGAKAFCETQSLNPRKLAEVVYTAMRATTPTAPVQDDDAEMTCNCRELPHHPLCIMAEDASRLSPTPETGLVEALRHVREFLMTAPLESGTCCCGDLIESHNIGSGHSPVDMLVYAAEQEVKTIDTALSNVSRLED